MYSVQLFRFHFIMVKESQYKYVEKKLWNYIVFFILILTVFDSFIHIFITLYLLHFNHLKEMLIVKN